MTAAQSTDFGQRAVQVMHETHFQIDSGAHGLLGLALLHETNQPVGQNVHSVGHWAAGRALAALIAIAEVRAGKVFDAEIVG